MRPRWACMRRWAQRCTGARARPTSPAARPSRAATCSSGSCSMRSTCSSHSCADPGGGVGRRAWGGRGQHLACPCCGIAAWVGDLSLGICPWVSADLLHAQRSRQPTLWPWCCMRVLGSELHAAIFALRCTSNRRPIRAEGALAQLSSMQTMGAHSFWYISFPFHVCCVISSRSSVACCRTALFWPQRRAVMTGEIVLE